LLGCDKKIIISARPAALTLLRGSDKKNNFLAARATQLLQKRPVTQKKITARQTATEHSKKLRALHRSVAVTKRPDMPTLLRQKKNSGARADQKKYCMAP
jgi:hypothetical protein